MKLYSLFSDENILLQHEGTEFSEVIRAMLFRLAPHLDKFDPEGLTRNIINRETHHPTLVTDEVCIPHQRLDGLPRMQVALTVMKEPILHPSDPDHKIRMLFLVLVPQDQNTLMLQTLAAIARLLSTPNFSQAIKGIRSENRLIRLIEESGIEVKRNLTASDIMENITHTVKLNTSLLEAVATLIDARDEGVPVLDDKGKLAGEITTREILILGMPKYMDLLANPEMLNAFEPFENYFRNESQTHVRDICRRDFVTVDPTEPAVKVAHMMITANRRRVYVMDEDKLLGIIYRKSIVEKVMNR